MPELPEVITVVNHIKSAEGSFITTTSSLDFDSLIVGEHLVKIHNIGKFICFDLESGKRFISHLRMTGQWHLLPLAAANLPYEVLNIGLGERSLRLTDIRKFATYKVLMPGVRDPTESLGPVVTDLTNQTLRDKVMTRFKKSRAKIKSFLLDQTNLSGIGNIYANEILWHSYTNPLTITKECNAELILSNTYSVIQDAISCNGSSVSDYKGGSYQNKLQVYKKHGNPCSRCYTTIVRDKFAGRSIYYCPSCQE